MNIDRVWMRTKPQGGNFVHSFMKLVLGIRISKSATLNEKTIFQTNVKNKFGVSSRDYNGGGGTPKSQDVVEPKIMGVDAPIEIDSKVLKIHELTQWLFQF